MRTLESPSERKQRPRVSGVAALVPDARLVERICSGDREAEELLYRRYAPEVLRVAQCLLRCRTEAEDVLQDTFIQAFADMPAVRAPGAVRHWLLRIATRQVHRRFRRRWLVRLLRPFAGPPGHAPEEPVGLDAFAAHGGSPEFLADLVSLERILTAEPAAHRVPWMLRRIEGYELEEVAYACGCSLATVKRHIRATDAAVRAGLGVDPEKEQGDG